MTTTSSSSEKLELESNEQNLHQDHQDYEHQHFWSTIALCSQVFNFLYLLMSVFPYTGFMCMRLLDLDQEHAGVYAGFLASSFMIGRAITSYPMGLIGDVYGRKFVLVGSSIIAAIGSLLFGLSTSYSMAIIVRFFIGFGNGVMVVARTSISELAKGDHILEAKGVGLLMSMIGYGMLISPAVGGLLSEPIQQYPDLFEDYDDASFIMRMLETFPFILPNLVSCICSISSAIFVIFTVEETLPKEKRRHWSHAGNDLINLLRQNVLRCSCCFNKAASVNKNSNIEGCGTVTTTSGSRLSYSTNLDDPSEPLSIDDLWEDEWEEDMKIFDSPAGGFEVAMSVLMTTPSARASFSSALHRPSITSHLTSEEQDPEQHRRLSLLCNKRISGTSSTGTGTGTGTGIRQQRPSSSSTTTTNADETTPLVMRTASGANTSSGDDNIKNNNSIQAIWGRKNTRLYLITTWCNSFTSVCQSETFPLFAMSTVGGLSMEEASIGIVGAISGLIYCIMQYIVFTQAMKHFGLIQTMRFGSLGAGVPVILIPISLFLKGWVQILFISIVNGSVSVSFSVFTGCSTIGSNRSVDATQRGAMNGVQGIGTALARALGPIFAGSLVTFGLTSGFVPPEFGGWVIYAVVALVGVASYLSSLLVPKEEEKAEIK